MIFLSGCANLFFAENCMKMKEFEPRGEEEGQGHVSANRVDNDN